MFSKTLTNKQNNMRPNNNKQWNDNELNTLVAALVISEMAGGDMISSVYRISNILPFRSMESSGSHCSVLSKDFDKCQLLSKMNAPH